MASRTWEQYEQYLIQQWPLTRREVQIAIECIKGNANKEIALTLGITSETVNKTLDQIYRTIEVNGRSQLLAKLLVADIDATPLTQSLTLTGEGAPMVAAGFLDIINAYRGNKKRPRSGTVLVSGVKKTLIHRPLKSATRQSGTKQKEVAAVARAGSAASPAVAIAEEGIRRQKTHSSDLSAADKRKTREG